MLKHWATMVLAGAVTAASCQEGFETASRCQFRMDPNALWSAAGYNLVLSDPPPSSCPIMLSQFGTNVNYAAEVQAFEDRPVGAQEWWINDALVRQIGSTYDWGFFGPANGQGIRKLQMVGRYPAGSAQYQAVMDDLFYTQGQVWTGQVGGLATAMIRLPYRCCPPPQTSVKPLTSSSFPRAQVGKPTTLRVFNNTYTASGFNSIKWYRNGVEINVPSNNPYAYDGPRTAYTHTYNSPGTYTWKVVAKYGFPEKTAQNTWTQIVDP